MDEPFYYLIPFFNIDIFKQLINNSYFIATHRTAYFMLLEPSIYLIENKKSKKINAKELKELITKPEIDFFKKDMIEYAKFLNSFEDIHITKRELEHFINNPKLRNIRTTYIVRDALLYYISHPSEDIDLAIKKYLRALFNFFQRESRGIGKFYTEVIEKCLSVKISKNF